MHVADLLVGVPSYISTINKCSCPSPINLITMPRDIGAHLLSASTKLLQLLTSFHQDSDPSYHLPIKSRKRARDDNTLENTPENAPEDKQPDSSLPDPKRRCSELEPSSSPPIPADQQPPTPLSSASPKDDEPTSRERSQARKASSRASPQSHSKSLKRALEPEGVDHDEPLTYDNKRGRKSSEEPTSTWVDRWIDSNCPTISAEQAAEAIFTLPTIETAEDDRMSQQDGVSQKSERLNSSSPLFRGVLKANRLLIDEMGDHIPPEVQALVDRHFRKARDSPKLGIETVEKVRQNIKKLWHNAEPSLSGIFVEPLFPTTTDLAQGGDTLWNSQALPRNPSYRYPISPPKTDRHFGFPTTLASTWDIEELDVADHPFIRPYSQPTNENMFPSYLREIKSEVKGGTLYAAESQLASAGAHRVNSWLWILNQLDPKRKQSSSDAVVFSDAGTQRQTVAYVHYFNPKDGMFYMSCIDQFYYRDDIQRCRDHMKNAIDWLLNTQQPVIRDALRQLKPIAKTWKKGRTASVATGPDPDPDAPESFDNDSQRSGKNVRLG